MQQMFAQQKLGAANLAEEQSIILQNIRQDEDKS